MDKYQRRNKRLKAEGKCSHCGRPCAPYTECADRRAYKNELRRQKSTFSRKPRMELTLPRGPRRLWTEIEDRKLRRVLMAQTPFKYICLNLDRTPWAIVARARRLGAGKFNEIQPLLSALQLGTLP